MASSISIWGNTVDISPSSPNVSHDARNTNYIYVQVEGDLKPDQQVALQNLGVEIQQYLGDGFYLCRYEPSDLSPIRALNFISVANVFHRALKIDPRLKNESFHGPVEVLLHKGAKPAAELAAAISGMDDVDENTVDSSYRRIRVTAGQNVVQQISRMDSVKFIEPVVQPVFGNNLARVDMHADLIVPHHLYTGEGQVISINDSGFDVGGPSRQVPPDVHPAFKDRVVGLIAVGRQNDTNDPNGHGTHVCGSAVGSGDSPNMGGTIEGTAPSASLVVSSLLDDTGKINLPADLFQMFKTPYGLYNSRISSNSWYNPSSSQLAYDNTALAIDNFCWDQKDCVVVFCAGNEGAKSGVSACQIGSVSAAKNVITVGATLGSRPNDGTKYVPQAQAPDIRAIAGYSSRGPTVEGRIKPDVVAPGTAILSTASRDPAITPQKRQEYGPSNDPHWMYMSGTSMSTPLVAGCCAVLRQVAIATTGSNPSAALIKALLINGSLSPGETHDQSAAAVSAPSGSGGFGFVDVARSIALQETGWIDNTEGLALTGSASHPVTFDPNSGRKGLKITLVYTDRPGSALENKLTLSMVAPDNSSVQDKGQVQENNVQQIIIHNVHGILQVRVTADRIPRPNEKQPYAVVWRFIE